MSMKWRLEKAYAKRFYFDACCYRIAQPKPWYRVALFKKGLTSTADNIQQEANIEENPSLIKWLTERIEY